MRLPDWLPVCALGISLVLAACSAMPSADPGGVAAAQTETPSSGPIATPLPSPTPVPPDLEVLDPSGWHRAGGNVIFEGEVLNQSNHSLGNITVRVTYYTQDLQMVMQVDGALDTDPLAPSESSQFAVTAPDDQSITQATIEFRGPNGTLSAVAES